MMCQKEVCGKMKQIGKSLIGYANTVEAVDNKVEAVLKDCDGNQLSIVIPVATCQKPEINKAFIRGNNLILEFSATIQLHKDVKNAMVDPKWVFHQIFYCVYTAWVTEEGRGISIGA